MTEGKVLYSADFTPVSSTCPECEGKGYKEYEAGLIQVKCRVCNGTGKTGEVKECTGIIGERPDDGEEGEILGGFLPPHEGDEVINDNPTDRGAGSDNQPTIKPGKRKRKLKKA